MEKIEIALGIIRIVSYFVISIVCLWRFLQWTRARYVLLSLSLVYANAIFVGLFILLEKDAQPLRDLQTIWVFILMISFILLEKHDHKYKELFSKSDNTI